MCKRHAFSFIPLFLAIMAFVLQFLMGDKFQIYCESVAFFLSTLAAVIEIILSENSARTTDRKIKKLEDEHLSFYMEGETLVVEKGMK